MFHIKQSKRKLLSSSALIGGVLLVDALLPGAALAAGACMGAFDLANSTFCPGLAQAGSIDYPTSNGAYAGGNFILTLGGTIVTNGATNLILAGAGETATLTASAGTSLTNAAGDAVNVQVNDGGIILSTNGTSILASGNDADGIRATVMAGIGTITITTKGAGAIQGLGTTAGNGGIVALSKDGFITIQVDNAGGIIGSFNGISAISKLGSVNIKGSSNITAAADGVGVRADSVGGDVVIDLTGTITGGNGILAGTVGAGITTITTGGSVVGLTDNGINGATQFGALTITTNGTVVGQKIGILTESSGNVTILTTQTVTGTNEEGIFVVNTAGGNVQITANKAVSGGTNGIQVRDQGAGVVQINTADSVTGTTKAGILTTTEDGATLIRAGGPVTGGVDGINASSSKSGEIVIEAARAVTGTTGDGIVAVTNGAGDVTISTTNPLASVFGGGGDGIRADTDDGIITVNSDGNVSGVANGINTLNGTGATIINNTAIVQGNTSGISAFSTTGTISIQNKAGTIGNASGVDSDLAITTTGGPTTLNNNDGTIVGRVTTGADADTFNQSGIWITEGTSDFGGNNNDVLNNSGSITVGNAPGVVETSFFTNLETFNNSGVIDLSDQAAGDGDTNFDTLTVSGNYIGNGGTLMVDAFLAGPGSQADRLIVNGDTSGSTALTVVDTNPGMGAFNQDGIIIVQVGGASNASDFTLAGGPITKGMFIYSLVFDAANKDFELVSAPGQVVIDGGGIPSGGQTVWYDTMGAWEGREADLCAPPQERLPTRAAQTPGAQTRTTQGFATPARASFVCPEQQGGIWAKALGGWTDREGDTDVGQSYVQRTFGFVGGIDQAMDVGENGHLLVGLLGGYVHSLQDFRLSPTTVTYEGGVLGGYATYKDGPFSLHGLVNANLLEADYSNPALGVDGKASAGLVNIGGRLDAAYRIGGQTGSFIEPIASVVAMTSDMGDLTLGTVTFHPGDNDSVRAGIGARVGAKMDMDTIIVETSLTGRVWNEFAAQNTLHVTTAVDPLDIHDDGLHGLMGEVNAALNVGFTGTGTSYFIKTDLRFKDQVTSGGLSAGLRFIW